MQLKTKDKKIQQKATASVAMRLQDGRTSVRFGLHRYCYMLHVDVPLGSSPLEGLLGGWKGKQCSVCSVGDQKV